MKRIIHITIVVLALVVLATYYVINVPLRAGYIGTVSVSLRGFQTNSFGKRVALVAITNAGSHVLQFATGTEIRGSSGWQDPSRIKNHTSLTMDADPILKPGTERLIAVVDPQAGAPWRAFAFCQVRQAQDWTAKLRFIANVYVFKRRIVEQFNTLEIPQ